MNPYLAYKALSCSIPPRLALRSAQSAFSQACPVLDARSNLYSCLNEATAILKQILHSSNLQLPSARGCLKRFQISPTASNVDDYIDDLVFESAVNELRQRSRSDRLHRKCPVQCIAARKPAFWAVNAACYQGSQKLLEIMLDEQFSIQHGLPDTFALSAAIICLSTAISNGHSDLAVFIIDRELSRDGMSAWYYSLNRNIMAAVATRNVEVVKILLGKYALDQQHVDRALTSLRSLPLCPGAATRFSAILELLIAYIHPARRTVLSELIINVAYLGTPSDIHLIADRDMLSSTHALLDYADEYRSALGSAASAGKSEVIEALLDRRYLAEVSNSRIRKVVFDAAHKALEAGHVHVYLILRKRSGHMIHFMHEDFELISGLDGADIPDLMREKLDKQGHPESFLDQPAGLMHSWTKQKTIGATALYLAIRGLRWRNVDMLLSLGLSLERSRTLKIPWLDHLRKTEAYQRTQEILHVYDAQTTLQIIY